MDILRELESTRDATLGHFALGPVDLDRRYGPDKWSIRLLLHHLADAEAVELERVRRTLCEDRPALSTFDPDAWARDLAYDRRSIDLSRALFESARNSVLELARLFHESRGHREYVHSARGPLTLTQQFEKVVLHNLKHLAHIHAALTRS